MIWESSLYDLFASLDPISLTFDPKIIYDHFKRRFIVLTLDKRSSPPPYSSRILLAVSKDGNPDSSSSNDWHFHEIESLLLIDGRLYWADYPGFEYDEEGKRGD